MPSPISDHIVPWPAAEAQRYVAEGYWAGVPLGTLLRTVADRRPHVPAVIDPVAGVALTYAELADRADALAIRLQELGIRRGDRVLVQLGNGWEFVVLTVACLRSGIVPVMALPGYRHAELSYLATHAEAVAIAVPDELRGFDHQALAHALAEPVTAVTGGGWRVLVAGDTVGPGSVDLRALCAPPPGRQCPRPPRRGSAGPVRCCGLPALRRYDRVAQAHRPHPRRLCLQRQGQRRGHRPRS